MSEHRLEMEKKERFGFGKNWQHFLGQLNAERIDKAVQTLREGFELDTLEGKRFLDAGSGSGLFSLAARKLGATVVSFDYDPDSVNCTRQLKERYFANDDAWVVYEGSVLDSEFLGSLGQFDFVYSWGVLHHTGNMWTALRNVTGLVSEGGKLFIAIYNDAGIKSRYWWQIKNLYVSYPALQMPLLVYATITTRTSWLIKGCLKLDPFMKWRNYKDQYRGMSAWYDLVDWVGGFPYEYATPDAIFNFAKERAFVLTRLETLGGGTGCNQFVFRRISLS